MPAQATDALLKALKSLVTGADVDRFGAMIRTPLLKKSAATFGPVGFVPSDARTEDEVKHELRHAKQFYVPGWSALKVIDAFYPYDEKPLERDAFRHVQESDERLRKQPGLISKLIERYLVDRMGK